MRRKTSWQKKKQELGRVLDVVRRYVIVTPHIDPKTDKFIFKEMRKIERLYNQLQIRGLR